ncbi:MAG: sensor histidine kinase [Bacteroidia bacterium]|nr:sensor histidine kinase [Bacteroidia bacterium]
MKDTSPKITLIIISIMLAVLIAAGIFIFNEEHSVYYALESFCISIISSFILLYFVNAIVVSKIKTISDTVKAFRTQSDDKQITKVDNSLNEVTALNNEIMAWAEDRKNEIERLKKLEVYRKEFLGNVSHELKTPIFNIQGYVLTLLDGGLEDETINRDYLQRAERSIDRMITIIDDLEAISQLETGELQIEPERFDIVALAKDVVEAQELKAKSKGILLNVQNDDKSIFVYADRFRIRQVIVNLIVNSIKYGKENGETKIRIYDMGENVSIEVADNGLGIAAEHLPRLFERFYRVDKSRSREQGGTGLGLAIVKHIIEAHNQTINVMSTVGAGTVFSFTLKKG